MGIYHKGKRIDTSGEVYSTEETRIGTWIDGKPLYRKAFEFVLLSSSANSFQNIARIPDAEGIKIAYGYVILATNGNTLYLPHHYYGEGQPDYCLLFSTGDQFNIQFNEIFLNSPCVAIAEYTKTTDSVPTKQATVLSSQVEFPETVSVDSPVTVTFPSTSVMASASAPYKYTKTTD